MFIRPLKLRNGHISWNTQVETIEESFNYNVALPRHTDHSFKTLQEFITNFLQKDAWKSILQKFEAQEHQPCVQMVYEKLLAESVIELRHLPYLYMHCSNTELTLDGSRRQYKLHVFTAGDSFGNEVYWNNKYTTVTLLCTDGEYELEELNLTRVRSLISEHETSVAPLAQQHIRQAYIFANANNLGQYYLQLLLSFYLGKSCMTTPVDMPGLLPRGSKLNAVTLRTYLKQHPNLRVSFRLSNSRGMWTLDLLIPVDYESRSTLYNMFDYQTKVTSLLPYAIRQKEERKAPLYGIELEVSTNYSVPDLIDAQRKQLFFFCKFDRSITGRMNNNLEMVTVPCSLSSHRKLWSSFFKELPPSKDKWDTSSKTNNGMHVHVSRKAFADEAHLKRFVWFFVNPSNYDFQYELSERHSKHSLEQYAHIPHVTSSTSLTNQSTVHKLLPWALANMTSLGHRGMVNTAGLHTIEVRLFRGLVSFATVMKNVEYVDALVNYTRDADVMSLTVEPFVRYVRLNIQKYPALHMFLENVDTEELITESLLHTVIGHLLDDPKPEHILGELQAHGVPQTQALCQHINRLTNEKAFYWNPAHQRIDHFDLNFARLQKHEDTLAAELIYTTDLEMELGAIE